MDRTNSTLDELMCIFYHGHRECRKILSIQDKILLVEVRLGVTVIQAEVLERENILRGIIISRMSETCPQCNGEGLKPDAVGKIELCPLCEGARRVSIVTREKYLLSHLIKPPCSKPALANIA